MLCGICFQDKRATNNHHLIPQSAGGKDGPTKDICSDCHEDVHAEISRILAAYRKGKPISGINWKTPSHPQEIHIATQVIMTGVRGIVEFEAHNLKVYKVPLPLPQPLHQAVKRLQKEVGASSIQKTIVQCILFMCRARNIPVDMTRLEMMQRANKN